jgi:hypothetical protein
MEMFDINSLSHVIRWYFYDNLHCAMKWELKNGDIVVHFDDGDTLSITSDEIAEAHTAYNEAYQ